MKKKDANCPTTETQGEIQNQVILLNSLVYGLSSWASQDFQD